jgi:5'-3' exonuclease
MSSPSLHNRRVIGPNSNRQRAKRLFSMCKTLDEVIAELGIKRHTASGYLYEARCQRDRERAKRLFSMGKTLDEVIAELGIKRHTASGYLYEARCQHDREQVLRDARRIQSASAGKSAEKCCRR